MNGTQVFLNNSCKELRKILMVILELDLQTENHYMKVMFTVYHSFVFIALRNKCLVRHLFPKARIPKIYRVLTLL